MSFSSRRRNYLLTPHRRDGLIEWMKSMLMHSFVLDALDTTGADTFSHFEVLIEEHRKMEREGSSRPSRLKKLVPTVGTFHTPLPLRKAFEIYNAKHSLTKRKHIQISFNEIRHIMNLAQVMALRKPTETEISAKQEPDTNLYLRAMETSGRNMSAFLADDDDAEGSAPPVGPLNGPKMITFDGDQTLYSDGSNFDSNPRLANYLYQLLRHEVIVAVVTAAGYEYNVEKYEFRLSGLLQYFKSKGLTPEECERFYLFGGECNYLLHLGSDYHLHPVKETGPGGWMTSTKYLSDAPANWPEEDIQGLLDSAEEAVSKSIEDLNLRGKLIRKRRSVGLVPKASQIIPREALDETVLRCQTTLQKVLQCNLPFCAFNGGRDMWVDVGNKRVGVQVLESYLGIAPEETLHIGDQFLNTGNDFAARDVCPCIWITGPEETTYILKTILRLAGIDVDLAAENALSEGTTTTSTTTSESRASVVDFQEMQRRQQAVTEMDVYTGEIKQK